jgi:hypothetical protein
MKTLFLILVTFLSVNLIANAQDDMSDTSSNLDITFGAKAGLNLATITGDLENIKSRTSFHIGGMAEIEISEDFAVQPELLYAAQGAKYDGFTLALDYLYVPIMAKYFVTEEFSLEAGPQFGYLLSAKLKEDSSNNNGGGGNVNTPERRAEPVDVKDSVKSFDFGLNIGASYLVDSNINLSARYFLGLANGNDFDDNEGDFKNSVFQLSVGYYFN